MAALSPSGVESRLIDVQPAKTMDWQILLCLFPALQRPAFVHSMPRLANNGIGDIG
jgi:hypothetical protein